MCAGSQRKIYRVTSMGDITHAAYGSGEKGGVASLERERKRGRGSAADKGRTSSHGSSRRESGGGRSSSGGGGGGGSRGKLSMSGGSSGGPDSHNKVRNDTYNDYCHH